MHRSSSGLFIRVVRTIERTEKSTLTLRGVTGRGFGASLRRCMQRLYRNNFHSTV